MMGKSFQFTPLREGRLVRVPSRYAIAKFQFTPLREGRPGFLEPQPPHPSISIHAPPRGATCRGGNAWRGHDFNSRPSARGDQPIPSHAREVLRFQFTPLREGRLSALGATGTARLFQFTPLREGRPCDEAPRPSAVYFNSRPSARGDNSRTD